MWKYRSSIIASIGFSIFTIVYYCLIILNVEVNIVGVGVLFLDYTYMFVMSAIIFQQSQYMMPTMLLITKFSTIHDLIIFVVVDILKKVAVFLGGFIVTLSILELIFNKGSSILILVYSYFVLMILFAFFISFICTCSHVNLQRNILIGIVIWNILIIEVIIFGINHPLTMFNPIVLLYEFNIFLIIRFLVVAIFMILLMRYKMITKKVGILHDKAI